MPAKKGKGKGKKGKPEGPPPDLVLKRLRRTYKETCASLDTPMERGFMRRLASYIEDGEDDFGNALPTQFVFPYGQDLLGPMGTRALVTTLNVAKYAHLKHLCFYRAGVTDEGVDALVDLIKARTCTVKNLELVDNHITHVGMKFLGIAMKTNDSLLTLVLDHNRFGDEGVHDFVEQAFVPPTRQALKYLSMKHCAIGPVGAKAIADRIINHSSLTYVATRARFLSPVPSMVSSH